MEYTSIYLPVYSRVDPPRITIYSLPRDSVSLFTNVRECTTGRSDDTDAIWEVYRKSMSLDRENDVEVTVVDDDSKQP